MTIIQSFFDGITLKINTNTEIDHYYLDVYGAEYGFLRFFYFSLARAFYLSRRDGRPKYLDGPKN